MTRLLGGAIEEKRWQRRVDEKKASDTCKPSVLRNKGEANVMFETWIDSLESSKIALWILWRCALQRAGWVSRRRLALRRMQGRVFSRGNRRSMSNIFPALEIVDFLARRVGRLSALG